MDARERAVRLSGKLLLEKAVREILGPIAAKKMWEDWEHSPGKKPRFRTLPFHFSTAHSGALSVVAVAKKGPVGVDVEEIKSIDWTHFEAWLHPAEKEKMRAAPDSSLTLLQLWTRKEAILKAAGTGIADADLAMLNTVVNPALFSGRSFVWKPLFLEEKYVGAVAQIMR